MDRNELANDLYGDLWFEFACGAELHPRFMELHRFLRGEPEELTKETMVLRDFIARYFLGLHVEDPEGELYHWLQYDFVNNGVLDPRIHMIQQMRGLPEKAATRDRTMEGGRTREIVDRDMDAVLSDGPWVDLGSPAEQAARGQTKYAVPVPFGFEDEIEAPTR